MIVTRIIAKNVTSTVILLDEILKSFGIAIIAQVVQINDKPAVSPFKSVIGQHNEARFR